MPESHVRKVAFTMYPIVDVDRARGFYEGVLGLAPGQQGQHGEIHWLEYDLPDGGCVALTNAPPKVPSGSAGGTIALEVDDLDALIAHLRAHDVPLLGELIHGPRCRMQICADPDGNTLVLHQLDRPAT